MIDWMEIDKPTMAKQIWVDKAIQEAAFVLERIDKRWLQKSLRRILCPELRCAERR